MPASRQIVIKTALFFLLLTVFYGCIKKHELPAGQAQDTNVTVPDNTQVSTTVSPAAVPIDTSLDQDIRTRYLENKIQQLEQRIALLEKQDPSQDNPLPEPKQAGTAPAAKPKPAAPPAQSAEADPVKLYNKGRALLINRNIDQAQALFSDFVKKYPEHDLAGNALYWLGECSYTTGKYQKAAQTFKTLVQTYPKDKKVPDALLKTGYAYMSIDDVKNANYYLKQVITRYPFSPAADKAQKKLSQTQ